ncbi:hypothetical protein ACFWGT_21210 [Nocardiopsis sp. NPDC060348]
MVGLEVYGEPDRRVREGLEGAGSEAPVTRRPPMAGLSRPPSA